jgi:hypothetical protein
MNELTSVFGGLFELDPLVIFALGRSGLGRIEEVDEGVFHAHRGLLSSALMLSPT